MIKKIVLSIICFISNLYFSQVGINTQTPKATLDVIAKTTDGSKPEGLMAPRLTGDQIKAADSQYGTAQTGTIIYATAAVTVASTKTAAITTSGYYYFDGSLWQKIGSGSSDNWGTQVAQTQGAVKGDGTAGNKIDIHGTSGGVLYGTGTGMSASFSSAGTNGQILRSNGTLAPSWTDANASLATKNIITGTSIPTATSPLTLANATGQVVGSNDASFTVNNTAPLWNANQLQGKDISTTAPSNGQVLSWDNSASQWKPAAPTAVQTVLIATISAPAYTGNETIIIDNNSGPHNFTLPIPASMNGKILYYRNNSATTGTAGTASFITYVPVNNPSCTPNRGLTLYSDGTNWYLVSGV
jgi:hypothetical protein